MYCKLYLNNKIHNQIIICRHFLRVDPDIRLIINLSPYSIELNYEKISHKFPHIANFYTEATIFFDKVNIHKEIQNAHIN